MVHADTILESLVTACKDSEFLPDTVTYSTIVLDSEGDHSDVTPPVIEFTVNTIQKDQSRNTEKVGTEFDENGIEIGYIFNEWFDLRVVAEITTVSGTKYTHRGLSQKLRKTLYKFDTHGLELPLPDPNNPNKPLENVNWLFLDAIEPDTDFALSPSVRTRQLSLEAGFTHEFRSTELGVEYDTVERVKVNNTEVK